MRILKWKSERNILRAIGGGVERRVGEDSSGRIGGEGERSKRI